MKGTVLIVLMEHSNDKRMLLYVVITDVCAESPAKHPGLC